MKSVKMKSIYIAWAAACLLALSIILMFVISFLFFITVLIFIALYVVIIFKMLHCPYCGKMETLINLTYAVNHQFYCRGCGEQIVVEQ